MNKIMKSFFNGLLILVPIALTSYVIWFVVTTLDGWIPVPIPGLGLLISLAFITLVGALTSNVVGNKLVELLEGTMKRLPVVRIVYTSLRDLMNAFVGERRSFDKPVMVDLIPEQGIRVFGFITCSHFDDPKLEGHVAVYLPQSYNFAGNLLIVPKKSVRRVDADGAQFMAFIVSGGVAEMNAARTVMDLSVDRK